MRDYLVLKDEFDRLLNECEEDNERHKGLTTDEIEALEEDEINRKNYVDMMLDSYYY